MMTNPPPYPVPPHLSGLITEQDYMSILNRDRRTIRLSNGIRIRPSGAYSFIMWKNLFGRRVLLGGFDCHEMIELLLLVPHLLLRRARHTGCLQPRYTSIAAVARERLQDRR